MTDVLYVTSMEPDAGKTVVALGVLDLLARSVRRPVVFRPVVPDRDAPDPLVELLRERYGLPGEHEDAVGLTWAEAAALVEVTDSGPDPRRLVAELVERAARLRARGDFLLVLGTDFTGPSPATELDLNAVLAVNLGAPVLTVVSARGKEPAVVSAAAREARSVLAARGCTRVATVVNRAAPGAAEALAERLRAEDADAPVYVLPEMAVLAALTVDEVVTALSGTVLAGSGPRLEREVAGYVVGSGHLQTVLPLLDDGVLLVTSGDRVDLAVGAAAAALGPDLPTPAGVVLTLGTRPDALGLRLLEPSGIPVVSVQQSTYAVLHRLEGLHGVIRPSSTRKVAAALGAFAAGVDAEELHERIRLSRTDAVTPAMFNARLLERARASRRTVVLPESEDERVLRAAEELVHLDVADLVLLGDPEEVAARAARLGLDLGPTRVVDPATSPLRPELARALAQRRAHKGVTLEAAHDLLADETYFGTLLVATGHADGMVSGATHTTAATIRPALEVIRTRPGVSRVSGAFLMCLPERVLVFADCAVTLDPTAEELAGIALSTAQTAQAFGIEPRVAMVSYSTGTSGAGADVEKVREATRLVAARRPDLPLTGPVQYDAAVDPVVAAAKLPGDPVAGRATVLVFPDLNTGNTTYKAVQRSADAVAVGPVLQGLRRPVNDLSRGCTVADVVSTVAITAVQAQHADDDAQAAQVAEPAQPAEPAGLAEPAAAGAEGAA
ncbi:phosphate acetyltransferase [Quadrisphaera sp. DSM 44207]|uniref:phosphate acetyltransferase n=1 Tax=Quadrisphaera sp. DSM 44207 TaxID=1881057 RepID=UPI000891F341|nr:phosphate acetyltransferase [Quadrisphaera sp. DSM 44207]SDQ04004.1 phosphate acetyltransferase [Quadrisphaera sp. DSM 44207]